jgi:hypothetical protein
MDYWFVYYLSVMHKNCCMDNTYFNMLLLLFQSKLFFFCALTLFFMWGWLHRTIIFKLGKRNFPVNSHRPTEKNMFFLCDYFIFLCGYPQIKIIFNLGERNFSVRVRLTEKLFLTANEFFYHYISVGIFPWIFAFFYGFSHTQKNSSFQ